MFRININVRCWRRSIIVKMSNRNLWNRARGFKPIKLMHKYVNMTQNLKHLKYAKPNKGERADAAVALYKSIILDRLPYSREKTDLLKRPTTRPRKNELLK